MKVVIFLHEATERGLSLAKLLCQPPTRGIPQEVDMWSKPDQSKFFPGIFSYTRARRTSFLYGSKSRMMGIETASGHILKENTFCDWKE